MGGFPGALTLTVDAMKVKEILTRFGTVKTEVGSIYIESNAMKDATWKKECGFKDEGQNLSPSVADCFMTDKSFYLNHDKHYCEQYTKDSTGFYGILGVVCDNTFKND